MANQRGFFRTVRTFILLVILLAVAGETWLSKWRTTEWDRPLWVTVYPINADGSLRVRQYIDQLQDRSFAPLETFFNAEAKRYRLSEQQPFSIRLGPVLEQAPPVPPTDGNRLMTALWSLQMRFWAWTTVRETDGPPATITLFVKYYDPALVDTLPHSLGLQKGLLGVVNAFAARSYRGQNQVVMAHELLHTVGATDKYDPATTRPSYPEGYAEPDRSPRYPQRLAELMGGRIPLSPQRAEMPRSLQRCLIGETTAREIGWED